MGTTRLLNEDDLELLVSCELGPDEEITEGIINCFEAAQIDVFAKSTVLDDWIEADVFEELTWNPAYPKYFSAIIWGHRVVISTDQIRLYSECDSTDLREKFDTAKTK
jgi:hypothetical protein